MMFTIGAHPESGFPPAGRRGSELGTRAMRTIWSVRWRGLEEEYRSRADALDRWDQLDAWGIEAELYEVAPGLRRRMR